MQTLTVIGGGASGFFCAVNAARLCSGLRVIIIEKTSKLLSKVKISGGGRCNVTHHQFDVQELIKKYPRGKNFLKKELYQFTPEDTIEWFGKRGVKIKAEADGRMFPVSNSSQSIIDCLLKEAEKYNVEIRMNTTVERIEKNNDEFVLHLKDQQIRTDYLVIACGGFPKVEQYNWMKNLNHKIEPPVPSLFTFNVPDTDIKNLMGLSVQNAEVKIAGTKLKESGPLLITHWGFSGPVVLRLSAWGALELNQKNYHFTIHVNWTGKYNEHTLREEWNSFRNKLSSQKIGNKNSFEIPARLWNFLLSKADINPETAWNNLPSKQQNKLMQILTADAYEVKGKTTFKEEFVTAGGVDLSEINSFTMQSRLHQNLYFCGEIMNVDGITGGFNFQHAWASGMIAAKNIAASVS